jgi:type VI secretion system secreted protein VgrG
VFIFQTASTLITASGSVVALTNGANPCNVFWQVTSSATLGTNSAFVGTILALTSVTATTTASVNGRLLARNGAVTLDSNTITNSCAAAAPTTTTTAPTTGASTTTPSSAITTPQILPGTGTSTSPQLLIAFGLVAAGAIMVVRRRDRGHL